MTIIIVTFIIYSILRKKTKKESIDEKPTEVRFPQFENSKFLAKSILENIPLDVIYLEISEAGAMGNTGGFII